MPRRMQRRALPVFALLAGLALPLNSVHALQSSTAAPHVSSPKTPGSSVWTWVAHLLETAWRKNGMAIDPNGQPGKNGMMIDPNGQPGVTEPGANGTAPVRGDNGSMPDPNG